MPHLKDYGVEGPLGFPLPDKQARALDHLLKALPTSDDYAYQHLLIHQAPTELNPGERSDVSWISTESPDRCKHVVIAKGMNDSQFQGNPLVTLGHAYWLPPVGRSLWRKRIKDGDLAGIKAKTVYPVRPDAWPAGDPWTPDKVFALIQAGLLQGKSIGILPTKVHTPDDRELQKHRWGDLVCLVIDEWLLIDYACVFIPANQDTLVEAVSKGLELAPDLLKAMGVDATLFRQPTHTGSPKAVPFTPLTEVENAVSAAIKAVDFEAMARRATQAAWERARGRV